MVRGFYLTPVKRFLSHSSQYFKFFSLVNSPQSVLTDNPVFNQGITQNHTVRGSIINTEIIRYNIFDTRLTLKQTSYCSPCNRCPLPVGELTETPKLSRSSSLSLKRYRQFSGFEPRPPTSVSFISSLFSVACFSSDLFSASLGPLHVLLLLLFSLCSRCSGVFFPFVPSKVFFTLPRTVAASC